MTIELSGDGTWQVVDDAGRVFKGEPLSGDDFY
jgi:hypothetical protein